LSPAPEDVPRADFEIDAPSANSDGQRGLKARTQTDRDTGSNDFA
jgi:hypothetical protein